MTKQAKKLQSARSSFERWQFKNGFRQQEAADLLKISLRQVQDYARGTSQHTDKPISPPYAVRILMRLIDEGLPTPPEWPE
jgi:hypothetical protein